MITRNVWEVSGRITDITKHGKGAVVRVKGEVFRRNIFSMEVEIDCIVRNSILKNLNLKRGRNITLAGHLDIDRDSYLIVDSVS